MTSPRKHAHVILGTIQVAVPFNPGDLQSAVKAEAEIRNAAAGLRTVRLVDVTTRMGKLPVPAPPADPVTAQHQKQSDMPAIPAGLRRT